MKQKVVPECTDLGSHDMKVPQQRYDGNGESSAWTNRRFGTNFAKFIEYLNTVGIQDSNRYSVRTQCYYRWHHGCIQADLTVASQDRYVLWSRQSGYKGEVKLARYRNYQVRIRFD